MVPDFPGTHILPFHQSISAAWPPPSPPSPSWSTLSPTPSPLSVPLVLFAGTSTWPKGMPFSPLLSPPPPVNAGIYLLLVPPPLSWNAPRPSAGGSLVNCPDPPPHFRRARPPPPPFLSRSFPGPCGVTAIFPSFPPRLPNRFFTFLPLSHENFLYPLACARLLLCWSPQHGRKPFFPSFFFPTAPELFSALSS